MRGAISLLIIMSVLLLLASPARAQNADVCTPEKEALHQPEPENFVEEDIYSKRRQKMVTFDKNCDGFIDAREWASFILEMFQAADLDHDNNLSSDEQQAMTEEYTIKTEKIMGATSIVQSREIQTALRIMDIDKNRIVTINEFVNFYAAIFRKMDKNKDNVIDIHEFNEEFAGIRRVRR